MTRRIAAMLRTALCLTVLAGWLAACALPKPPARQAPQGTQLPVLAVTLAPTLDAGATATLLAQPITATPDLAGTATASAPTPTPAAAEPERYVVQVGDTLAGIAAQFETTVDELVAANGLSDPNAIEVGQELVIPARAEAP